MRFLSLCVVAVVALMVMSVDAQAFGGRRAKNCGSCEKVKVSTKVKVKSCESRVGGLVSNVVGHVTKLVGCNSCRQSASVLVAPAVAAPAKAPAAQVAPAAPKK